MFMLYGVGKTDIIELFGNSNMDTYTVQWKSRLDKPRVRLLISDIYRLDWNNNDFNNSENAIYLNNPIRVNCNIFEALRSMLSLMNNNNYFTTIGDGKYTTTAMVGTNEMFLTLANLNANHMGSVSFLERLIEGMYLLIDGHMVDFYVNNNNTKNTTLMITANENFGAIGIITI